MQRTLLDIFNRYTPTDKEREILLSATDIRLRVDREGRKTEVTARFPKRIPKRNYTHLRST